MGVFLKMAPSQLGPKEPKGCGNPGEAGLWHLEHDKKGRVGSQEPPAAPWVSKGRVEPQPRG